jgi:hypothetical protein
MSNFSHDRVPDGKEEWLTDPKIIHNLGRFDLDPCSPVKRPWDTAHTHYSIEEDRNIHGIAEESRQRNSPGLCANGD